MLVAVSQRVEVLPERRERRDALEQGWVSFLDACGFLPLLIPNRVETARRLLQQIPVCGLLLTGGNDLCAYGGDAPERDETERVLLEDAERSALPVIGVCRGMQLIQNCYGIRLSAVEGHVGEHAIAINQSRTNVNSFHRMGASVTAPNLHVWARSDDGVVEAVRDDATRRLGIMWHPERTQTVSPRDVALFRTWFGGGVPDV